MNLEQIIKEAESKFDEFMWEEWQEWMHKEGYNPDYAKMKVNETKSFLTEQIKLAVEKALEAIRLDGFVSPHVPPDGFKSEHPRCGDCFCTEQTDHTHSLAVAEQANKIKEFKN